MANANETKGQQGGKSETQQGSKSDAQQSKKGEDTDIELIKHQLERLREDFTALGEMVGMTARHRYQSARDDLARNAETTKAQAVDQLTASLNEAEATVRRNPLTALAIVLGIGYLFGLFSRK